MMPFRKCFISSKSDATMNTKVVPVECPTYMTSFRPVISPTFIKLGNKSLAARVSKLELIVLKSYQHQERYQRAIPLICRVQTIHCSVGISGTW
jgi:hypothetical protein